MGQALNITASTIFGILQRYRREKALDEKTAFKYKYALLGNFLRLFEIMKDWRNNSSTISDTATNLRDTLMHAWDKLSFAQIISLAETFSNSNGLENNLHRTMTAIQPSSSITEQAALVRIKVDIENQLQQLYATIQQPETSNQKFSLREYKIQIEDLFNGLKASVAGKRIEDIDGFDSPAYEDARYAWSTYMVLIGGTRTTNSPWLWQ
jgi:hypothetical protein